MGNFEQVDLSPNWKAARMERELEKESFRRSSENYKGGMKHHCPVPPTPRSALRDDSTVQQRHTYRSIDYLMQKVETILSSERGPSPVEVRLRMKGIFKHYFCFSTPLQNFMFQWNLKSRRLEMKIGTVITPSKITFNENSFRQTLRCMSV